MPLDPFLDRSTPDTAKAAASAFAGVALGVEPTTAGGAADVPLSKDGRLCFTPLTMHPEANASTAVAVSGDLTQTVVPRRRERVARPLETLTGVDEMLHLFDFWRSTNPSCSRRGRVAGSLKEG